MVSRRIRWGRVLWILLTLNAFLVIGLTTWVTKQQLEHPSQRILSGLAETGLSLGAYSAFFYITTVLEFLPFFIVALLIYLRRPHDGFALFVSIFLVNYGAATSYPQYAEYLSFYLDPPWWYAIPFNLAQLCSWPLFVAFLVLFPDGKFEPKWTRYLAILGAFPTTAWILFPSLFTNFPSTVAVIGGLTVLFLMAATFYARVWRYHHYASLMERQQTKWFLLAVFILVFSALVYFIPAIFFGASPQPSSTTTLWNDFSSMIPQLGFIVQPLAVGFAILRYRLWDIDIIIRKTLTYAIVAALLAVIYFGSVILLQQIFAQLTGQRSEVTTVLSTLAIAALFVPLRNRIQALVDRRFYRKKYDAQQVLNDFAQTVRDETDLENLTGRLMQVVYETMQPKSVSMWLKPRSNEGRQTWESK